MSAALAGGGRPVLRLELAPRGTANGDRQVGRQKVALVSPRGARPVVDVAVLEQGVVARICDHRGRAGNRGKRADRSNGQPALSAVGDPIGTNNRELWRLPRDVSKHAG